MEQGVGALPTLEATIRHQEDHVVLKEGWALMAAKKAYRFSDKQKSYPQAKFRMGQATGRKLDAEIVAREIRRARGPDGKRLFQASVEAIQLQHPLVYDQYDLCVMRWKGL